MKPKAAPIFWTCTLLLAAGLGCRLLWVAWQTETGLQTLKWQWRDATLGLLVGSRTSIHEREPIDQAEYWLLETGRVLREHPDDARLAIGAALVLDSPSMGYIRNYVEKIETFPGFGTFPEIDREGIVRAEDAFESRCRERCLEYAAAATDIDPSEKEWWRLRAMLLWRESMHSLDSGPRTANWQEVIEECARHDPENALYDYLAAEFEWESSATKEMSIPNGVMREWLDVTDPAGFERGIAHFERGQRKPYLAVGDAGFTAVAEFLGSAQIPIFDHVQVVESRQIHMRRILLLRGIWRWQQYRAVEKASAGDVSSALELYRQNLHLIDQYTGAMASTAYDNVAMASRVGTTSTMNLLAEEHRNSLPSAEIEEIIALEETARLKRKVVEKAAQELATSDPQWRTGAAFQGLSISIIFLHLVWVAPSSAFFLFLIGLTAIACSRFIAGGDYPIVGWVWQTIAMVSSGVVTFVVFGLAPANIISHHVQAWVLTVLIVLGPFAFVSWLAWK